MSTATPPAPKTIKEKLAVAANNVKAAVTSGDDLQAKITELQGNHAEAAAEIDRLTTLSTTQATTITTHVGEIKTLTETVTKITGERDTATATIEAQAKEIESLKALAKTVSESITTQLPDAVMEKLAEIGLPAATAPKTQDGPPGKGSKELHAKYQELLATNPKAAGEFFATNREKILT
jgi:chromosome segregation ATPase